MHNHNAKCRRCEKTCWVPDAAFGRASGPKCFECGGLLDRTDDVPALARDAKARRTEPLRVQCGTAEPPGHRTTSRSSKRRNRGKQ